uniref:Uncharacterized protein n=1 Tax=Mus musculus TaxID=10090 RepID=Q9D4Q4_MOUSE|nr:unnamed protein product [Mus musculus]
MGIAAWILLMIRDLIGFEAVSKIPVQSGGCRGSRASAMSPEYDAKNPETLGGDRDHCQHKNVITYWDRRDGSTVTSTSCSSRRSRFSSQNPSLLSVNLMLRDLTPLSGFHELQAHMWWHLKAISKTTLRLPLCVTLALTTVSSTIAEHLQACL